MITNRSISIGGSVTSISLEPEFWDELERRATSQHLSWQNFTRELLEKCPDVGNRSATIRTCLLGMLKGELFRTQKQRKETWWTVRHASGATHEIGSRGSILLVGRDAVSDIVIDDVEVSRKHIMLCWDRESWWAVDLDSKNGMLVKGKKKKVVKIVAHSAIVIGNSSIMLMS